MQVPSVGFRTLTRVHCGFFITADSPSDFWNHPPLYLRIFSLFETFSDCLKTRLFCLGITPPLNTLKVQVPHYYLTIMTTTFTDTIVTITLDTSLVGVATIYFNARKFQTSNWPVSLSLSLWQLTGHSADALEEIAGD